MVAELLQSDKNVRVGNQLLQALSQISRTTAQIYGQWTTQFVDAFIAGVEQVGARDGVDATETAEAAWAGVLGSHLLSSALESDAIIRLVRTWRLIVRATLPDHLLDEYFGLIEQKAMQLADARNTSAAPSRPPPGNPDSRSAENAMYGVALKDAITRQWTRPESIPLGVPCQVRIRQIPGGEVVDVQVSGNCPYDQLGKRSLEAAVLKASPLPYAGFEDVFNRDVILTFRPEDVDDLRK